MGFQSATAVSDTRHRFFYGYVIVAAVFLMMVLTYGARYSFGIFLKPMSVELGWTRAMTSGAFSVTWIMEAALSIAIGHLTDRFGPRLIMTILGLLAGIGYLLMAQTDAIWQLYLFYGVIGGAGSSVYVPLTSTIARWFTRRRSTMTGLAISGIGIGALIGPVVSARLLAAFDWRTTFVILGAALLVVITLAAQFLRRDPAQVGQTPYGEELAKEKGGQAVPSGLTLAGALRTRKFWLFSGMMFCLGFPFFTIQVHLAPYLTDIGWSAGTGAAALAAIGGAGIIGRGLLGSIGDKIGNKRAFLLGFVLMTLSLVWLLAFVEPRALYAFAFVFGLGFGNSSTQQVPLAAALFGLKSLGLVFAVAGIGFTVGAALGPLVAGHLFDVYGNYKMAFLAAAGISFLGFVVNAFLPSKQPRPA